MKKLSVLAATVLCLALVAVAATASAGGRREVLEFDELRFYLEANQTDEDAEIVLEFDSEEASLRFLDIHVPNGRRIMRLASNDRQKLGLRQGSLESPEPGPEDVLAAYPEGVYTFRGRSVDNRIVFGQVELSHDLPPAPEITSPEADAEDVALNGLGAVWSAVEGATGYVLELERETEDAEFALKVDIPAGTTSFTFPPGWVLPDTEYQLGIAVKGENGNVSVAEISFTTGS